MRPTSQPSPVNRMFRTSVLAWRANYLANKAKTQTADRQPSAAPNQAARSANQSSA